MKKKIALVALGALVSTSSLASAVPSTSDKAAAAARDRAEVAETDAADLASAVAAVRPPAVTASEACRRDGKAAAALTAAAAAFDAEVMGVRQLRHVFDAMEARGRSLWDFIGSEDRPPAITIYPAVEAPIEAAMTAVCKALARKPSRAQQLAVAQTLQGLTEQVASIAAGMQLARSQAKVSCFVSCFGRDDDDDYSCLRTLAGGSNPYGRYAADVVAVAEHGGPAAASATE